MHNARNYEAGIEIVAPLPGTGEELPDEYLPGLLRCYWSMNSTLFRYVRRNAAKHLSDMQ